MNPDNDYDVLIVTYNRVSLLKECIRCCLDQTLPPSHIIVVDNASSDGTSDYLNECSSSMSNLVNIRLDDNIGGAGGFSTGMKVSLKYDSSWVILIDDDAMLENNYWEETLKQIQKHSDTLAFSGSVYVNGTIDTGHRSRLIRFKKGLRYHQKYEPVHRNRYGSEFFETDNVTFCGLTVKKTLIRDIGLPLSEYFIWNDDLEYSIRIRKKSKIINCNRAHIDHRTSLMAGSRSADGIRYIWKEYYRIRNRIDISKRYDGFLKTAKLCFVYCIEALHCIKMKLLDSRDSGDWKYNETLIIKAVHDGILHRMGKNSQYS